MPASMFNQKQKNSFLKWYDEILGGKPQSASTEKQPEKKKFPWQEDEEEYEEYNEDDQ
jgi:hypothetical protein